ncbi:MAG: hypothetical protein ACI9AD_000468 [Nitriliruptoraceae bacterium]
MKPDLPHNPRPGAGINHPDVEDVATTTTSLGVPVRLRPFFTAFTAAAMIAAVPMPGLSDAGAVLAAPPAGAISDNVEFVSNTQLPAAAIGMAFDGDVVFITTAAGLFSYDISDPAAPALLGSLPYYIWENEDMTYDAERKLLFVSRDPRGFTGIVAPAELRFFGQVEIFDVSNPAVFVPVNAFTLPAGHTSTCISGGDGPCDFTWTGGPYGTTQLGDPYGRPIYATDITDPRNPVACPEPVNMNLKPDGGTGYAHDVQVDDDGIAWVSSEGGIHGYWTYGEHVDPTTGVTRTATGCNPVPYGGGVSPTDATPSRFMHNAWRPTHLGIPGDDESIGHVLLATEEDTSTDCAASGRFATYDLRSSLDGSGFTNPEGFELDALDSWTPEGVEGATGCASAHYFQDRGDALLTYAFYGQGVRFLDVSDPRDIRQVGYYRPDGGNAFASYWHDGYVYVADVGRGMDVVRVIDEAGAEVETGASATMRTVEAPMLAAGALDDSALYDARTGYTCRLPLGG